MLNLTEHFQRYLQFYSQKNLDGIAAMLADTVSLRDWKISVTGKAAAVAETRKNFSQAETISIEILHLLESANSVAGELRIVVDESEVLHVVDVISFNESGHITAIRAYLGRAD